MKVPKFVPGQVIRAELDGEIVVGFVRLVKLVSIEAPDGELIEDWQYTLVDMDLPIWENRITHHYRPDIKLWVEIEN